MNEDTKDMIILGIFGLIVAIALVFIPNSHPPRTEIYYETHTVQEGETLSEIVLDYGGSLEKTQGLNGGSVIMPGQRIQVVVEVER